MLLKSWAPWVCEAAQAGWRTWVLGGSGPAALPGAAPILPPRDPSRSRGLFKLLSHTSVVRFSFSRSPRFQRESVSGSHTRCPRVGGARRIPQHLQIPAPSTQGQSTASPPRPAHKGSPAPELQKPGIHPLRSSFAQLFFPPES